MAPDFDTFIDRRPSDSMKWRQYGPDVLPMWVADMDFQAPEVALRAMRERLEHGVLGYAYEPQSEILEAITGYLSRHHGWKVDPSAVVLLPGTVPGFHVACRAVTQPADSLLTLVPVYPPILQCAKNLGLGLDEVVLTPDASGAYGIDGEALQAAIHSRTRVLLLSNPHNPVGRVFRREELTLLAEACLRQGLSIVSDEVHCDLVFRGHPHLPIALLSPEVEARTITLMSPSKSFNLAGLKTAFAVIPNAALREKFLAAREGLLAAPNLLGCAAMNAVYREGDPWLRALREYLEGNRDLLVDFVRTELPGVRVTAPEGTYLAWLDCREAGIAGRPFPFFLKQARVALNPGESFGRGGEGFVRLNFGCPRAVLREGLERMRRALHE
ncbi:MAG: MalY/PatB family protein [Hyalangium sp.]|uniref:MalY/PatB family protein n=1 Tax=Hyalangium sp. TaxID=2028555 RepID=UPI00389A3AB0